MQPEVQFNVEPAPLIKIKVTYPDDVVDEYDIEQGVMHKLLDHYWDNPNVISVAFSRAPQG